MKNMILATIATLSIQAQAQTFLADTKVPAELQSPIVKYISVRCPEAKGLREVETQVDVQSEDQGVHDSTFSTLFDTDNGSYIEVFSAKYAISNPAVRNIEVLGLLSENGLCKE